MFTRPIRKESHLTRKINLFSANNCKLVKIPYFRAKQQSRMSNFKKQVYFCQVALSSLPALTIDAMVNIRSISPIQIAVCGDRSHFLKMLGYSRDSRKTSLSSVKKYGILHFTVSLRIYSRTSSIKQEGNWQAQNPAPAAEIYSKKLKLAPEVGKS